MSGIWAPLDKVCLSAPGCIHVNSSGDCRLGISGSDARYERSKTIILAHHCEAAPIRPRARAAGRHGHAIKSMLTVWAHRGGSLRCVSISRWSSALLHFVAYVGMSTTSPPV